jgi:hypothetical protein
MIKILKAGKTNILLGLATALNSGRLSMDSVSYDAVVDVSNLHNLSDMRKFEYVFAVCICLFCTHAYVSQECPVYESAVHGSESQGRQLADSSR